jgi:undecaprenyl-diphosphatase
MNNFDRSLMLWLNFDGGAWLDAVMEFASARLVWIPLYLLLIYLIFRWLGWRRAFIAIVFVVVGVVAADQICNLFKSTIPSPRPTHTDLLPHLSNVVKLGGASGTASSHAANTFFLFTFVSLLLRRRWLTLTLLLWAFLVSYSRIYLGLHFPLQILLGIAVGATVALLLFLIFKLLPNKCRSSQNGSISPINT